MDERAKLETITKVKQREGISSGWATQNHFQITWGDYEVLEKWKDRVVNTFERKT